MRANMDGPIGYLGSLVATPLIRSPVVLLTVAIRPDISVSGQPMNVPVPCTPPGLMTGPSSAVSSVLNARSYVPC